IDTSSGGGSDGDGGIQDQYNIVRGMRGLSAFDARHRLALSYVIEVPFGPGHRFLGTASGIGKVLASGWQISGISTIQTGRPFTVGAGSDISNTAGSDRPNLIGNPNLPSGERGPDRWFNTSAFAYAARGTFGNEGRNTLIGPGLNTTDLSLVKN